MAISQSSGGTVSISGHEINTQFGYLLIFTEGRIVIQEINSTTDPIKYFRNTAISSSNDILYRISKGSGVKKYMLYENWIGTKKLLSYSNSITSTYKIRFFNYGQGLGTDAPLLQSEEQWRIALNFIFTEYHSAYRFKVFDDQNDDLYDSNIIDIHANASQNATVAIPLGHNTNHDHGNRSYFIDTQPSVYTSQPFTLVHEIIHYLLIENGYVGSPGNPSHHRPKGIMHGSAYGLHIDLHTLLRLHYSNNPFDVAVSNSDIDKASEQTIPTDLGADEYWTSIALFLGCSKDSNFFFRKPLPLGLRALDHLFISMNPDYLLSEIIAARKKKRLKAYTAIILRKAASEWNFFNSIPGLEGELGLSKNEYVANSRALHVKQGLDNTLIALSYLNTKYHFDEEFINRLNKYLSSQNIEHLPILDAGSIEFGG